MISATRLSSVAFAALLLAPGMARAEALCKADPSPGRYVAMRGVNLPGGGDGGASEYPGVAQLDYYKSKKMMLTRMPFFWRLLQPKLYGPLDPKALAEMDVFVAGAAARGMYVVLDACDSARYGSLIVGSPTVPISAFVDFWKKMAMHYGCRPGIYGYDLTNEPHGMGPYSWGDAAQAAIYGIRTVDKMTPIIVEGEGWDDARQWPKTNPEFPLRDPADRIIYEAHCYFDRIDGGYYGETYDHQKAWPTIGVDRIKPFVDWIKLHHVRGYLGEYGVPATDPRWLTALDLFLADLKANNISGTYWAGGAFKCEVATTITSCSKTDTPQMKVAEKYP